MLHYTQEGDYMKPNTSKFWMVVSIVYLPVLFAIIWIFNPDFGEYKTWLLLVPMYVPLLVSTCLRHKNDNNARYIKWDAKILFLVFTAIFALFKLLVDSIK